MFMSAKFGGTGLAEAWQVAVTRGPMVARTRFG
jgi:hypothetical protein